MIGVQVLTKYGADVTGHVQGVEKIKRVDKERVDAAIEGNRKVSDSVKEGIKDLGKQALAAAAVVASYGFMKDSWAAYAEHARLTSATTNIDIEKLRKASAGLKNDHQLLAEAARFQAGAYKLTSEQMQVAERAMRTYAARGIEAAKANEAITQAVTALKVDGLKDLGVFVDTAGLSMEKAGDRAKIFERIMGTLREQTQGVNDDQLTTAERMAATGVSFQNAMERMKIALGQLLVKLTPVVEKIAQAVGFIAGGDGQASAPKRALYASAAALRSSMDKAFGGDGETLSLEAYEQHREGKASVGIGQTYLANASMVAYAENLKRLQGRSQAYQQFAAGNIGADATDAEALIASLQQMAGSYRYTPAGTSWTDGEKPGARGELTEAQRRALFMRLVGVSGGSGNVGLGDSNLFGSSLYGPGDSSSLFNTLDDRLRANTTPLDEFGRPVSIDPEQARIGAMGPELTRRWNERLDIHTKQESKLAGMFGPLTDFNAYKIAFDALGGAVGSAMTAWIDGSMSAGKAFKAFIGEAVKGLAIQMAMEALKHGAYAIGSLAFGNAAGAAMHGKAAAAFTVGAAAAAVLAKELHVSTAAPARGAGAAAPVGGAAGAAGGGYQGQHVIYVIGDPYGDTSPRERARTMGRRLEEVRGAPGAAFR